jgi:5'-3' exonuclease
MWRNLEDYLDMLMDIVNPQKLVFFAIDGVAPRAKMNQQRCRRFRAAQEICKGKQRKEKLAEVWQKEGIEVPKDWVNVRSWDHNVITPGTEFMEDCANV